MTTTTAAQRGPVEVGDMAPDFTLPMYPDGDFILNEHRGHTVVLYFYPGDDTPVCTKQALAFKDMMDDFEAADAMIVGVSADSMDSHEAFAEKYDLQFPLLVDNNHRVRNMFGQPGGGDEVQGRITYIIDGDGVVRHIIMEEDDMGGHVSEALDVVQEMADDAENEAGSAS